MLLIIFVSLGILNCVNAQIDCYQVIPTLESMVREVSNSVVVSFFKPETFVKVVNFQQFWYFFVPCFPLFPNVPQCTLVYHSVPYFTSYTLLYLVHLIVPRVPYCTSCNLFYLVYLIVPRVPYCTSWSFTLQYLVVVYLIVTRVPYCTFLYVLVKNQHQNIKSRQV